ncbi:MAG: hypothetical protein IPG76_23855 [Acidobacteria bacterium]|nr:hypothetical protein [Acidobacteriota bacterium]
MSWSRISVMPVEDGYALIARIRAYESEMGGQVPAIALTAFAAAQDKDKALSAGFQSASLETCRACSTGQACRPGPRSQRRRNKSVIEQNR